jgi:hypothetical protein
MGVDEMVMEEQTHAHDVAGPNLATDTCPLCGSKISREEFLRVEEKIRAEVEGKSREEIARITALKDREIESAVAAREALVRKDLSDEFGRETSQALRKQRDEIEELHVRHLLEKDEERENLEKRAAELEATVAELAAGKNRQTSEAAEKLAAVVLERDKALQNIRALEAREAQTRAELETQISERYETNIKELREAVDEARFEKASTSYYRKLWIDDVMKKAAYPSA